MYKLFNINIKITYILHKHTHFYKHNALKPTKFLYKYKIKLH